MSTNELILWIEYLEIHTASQRAKEERCNPSTGKSRQKDLTKLEAAFEFQMNGLRDQITKIGSEA